MYICKFFFMKKQKIQKLIVIHMRGEYNTINIFNTQVCLYIYIYIADRRNVYRDRIYNIKG